MNNRIIASAIAVAMLSGCAAEKYYESQPIRDRAEAARVAAATSGLERIVSAYRKPTVKVVQVVNRRVASANNTDTCKDCGGGEIGDDGTLSFIRDPDGAWVEQSTAGTDHEVQPAEIDGLCPDCLDGAAAGIGPVRGVSPPENSGQLLLNYILRQQEAAARQAAAQEETEQVKAIMSAYVQAVTKPQASQAAPWTPDATAKALVQQLPFLGTVIGLTSLGKAGVQGAIGDTSNTKTTVTDITTTTGHQE